MVWGPCWALHLCHLLETAFQVELDRLLLQIRDMGPRRMGEQPVVHPDNGTLLSDRKKCTTKPQKDLKRF